jgi:hypothetical protein
MASKHMIILAAFVLSGCQAQPPGARAASEQTEKPTRASICQLTKDPAAYDHRLIAVEGELSIGNEEFSLYAKDSSCGSVWLDIGGKAVSGTIYCCGGNQGYSRSDTMTVEGVEIALSDDAETKSAIKRI